MIIIKKSIFKGIFDLLMAIILFLMFDKMALGLKFHEIAGLVLFLLFFTHIIINRKWVISVTKKLFSKQIPIKTKVNYIVNFLLLIDMLLIMISGIFISKIVFDIFNLPDFRLAKRLHFFSSSLFIILIGIHIGLHWNWIVSIFKKIFKIPNDFKINKIATTFGLIFVLGIGIFNMNTTKFSRWINISSSPQFKGKMEEVEKGRNKETTNNDKKVINNPDNHDIENTHKKDRKDNINILKAIISGLRFISISLVFSIIAYYLSKYFLI